MKIINKKNLLQLPEMPEDLKMHGIKKYIVTRGPYKNSIIHYNTLEDSWSLYLIEQVTIK